MNISEILDLMDDMLDASWSVPLSGGKCVIDVERFREMVADVRLNMPQEIKQAKLIVGDRKIILDDAKKEADNIVFVSQERARRIVEESEIVRASKERAKEIMLNANTNAKELKRAANEFAENVLRITETHLNESTNQVKAAKIALKNSKNNQ